MPFRNWRDHCVRGRATSELHREVVRSSATPTIGIDYMWMMSAYDDDRGNSTHGMPIIVMADQESGWLYEWVSPEKGRQRACDTHARESGGRPRFLANTFQERSGTGQQTVKGNAKRTSGVQLVCAESPVGESRSLGSISCAMYGTHVARCSGLAIREATSRGPSIDSMVGDARGRNPQQVQGWG